ncbi:MAG: hypothetical protein E2O39_05125 [Planctomycetota bacterium]|nr:MAG: hypothetical protein E2O39_05125 [Planctomycetota bacterium]
MKDLLRGRFLFASLVVLSSSGASAQGTQTHRFDIPSDYISGSITFVSMIGPPAGYLIRARVHLEFTTGGTFTADDLEVRFNAPTTPNLPEWVVMGDADFGWGSTPGTWIGDAESTILNGEIYWSIWDLSYGPQLGSGHNGVTGQFQNSYFEIDYVPAGEGPGEPYCFGSSCPCGNDDPTAGCTNATGSGALLHASGTASLALDDLTLTVSSSVPLQFGILYMGPARTLLPFGNGHRCVDSGTGAFHRYPVMQANAAGTFAMNNVVSFANGTFPPSGALLPGTTWNFQGWYRDPGGPCGASFNLTNAVEISVIP